MAKASLRFLFVVLAVAALITCPGAEARRRRRSRRRVQRFNSPEEFCQLAQERGFCSRSPWCPEFCAQFAPIEPVYDPVVQPQEVIQPDPAVQSEVVVEPDPVVQQQPVIDSEPIPAAGGFECSMTDTSPRAVEECVNAVRVDPLRWQEATDCDLSIYQPAPPLNPDSSLTVAAQIHADDMANVYGNINHDGFPSRLRDAGYTGNRITENVAWWYGGAFHVVMGWMCSSGHAQNIMDCGVQSFGTGVNCPPNENCYYCQTFGGDGRC